MTGPARTIAVLLALAVALMGVTYWVTRDPDLPAAAPNLPSAALDAGTRFAQPSVTQPLELEDAALAATAVPLPSITATPAIDAAALALPMNPSPMGVEGLPDVSVAVMHDDTVRADQTFLTQLSLLRTSPPRDEDDARFVQTFLPEVRAALTPSAIAQCRAQVSLRTDAFTPDWSKTRYGTQDGHRVVRVNVKGFGGVGFHETDGQWLADEVWCAPRLP